MSIGITTVLAGLAGQAIDRVFPDQEEAMRVKAELQQQLHQMDAKKVEAAKDIIVAESGGDKWQRRWRPALMYALITILVNNYVLAPYLEAIFDWSVVLEMPDNLWDILKIGLGGYIVGRSAEKITDKGGAKTLYDNVLGKH